MAKTKINPKTLDWDEVSTGTVVSGGNLGLDSNDNIVKTTISGGGGISFDGSTANGILTYKDSDEATVESNLTFDGTDLTVVGAGSIYVDKIRRASDSGTTTKILLNDEVIKLYAGDSSNNVCTIDSTGLKIDNGSLETATIDFTDGDLSMTIADGGKVTFASGFDVGSDAAGDILYHNGTSYVRLAKGTANQVLTMNDAATAPNWETAAGGGTDTQNITLVGSAYGYNNYTHRYTVHENGSSTSTLGTKWTEYKSGWGGPTSTSVSTTGVEALANWACWIAPEDCTLKDFYGAYTSDNGSIDVYLSLWQASPSNQDTSVTWTRRAFVTRSGGSITSGGLTPVSSTGMSVSVTAGDLFAVALSGETGSDSGALGNVFFTAAIKVEV